MKPFKILLLFVASNLLVNTVRALKSRSRRVNQFWTPRNNQRRRYSQVNHQQLPTPNQLSFPVMGPGHSYFIYHRSSDDDSKDSYLPMNYFSSDTTTTTATSTSTTTKKPETGSGSDEMRATGDMDKPAQQVPQINFYNSVPNGIGVIGQGLLWLREISNAVGTPLPMWIGAIPLMIVGVSLMFFPDLTNIGLPLFYPSGAEGDPLAAFPPIAEITIPDFANSDFIQQLTKLLPAKLVSMSMKKEKTK